MLCQICASIGLKDALGVIPDSLDVPLHKEDKFTPQTLHYETYTLMRAAAEYCQLCALVVKGRNALTEWGPYPDTRIYRIVEREEQEKKEDILLNQARHISIVNFGTKWPVPKGEKQSWRRSDSKRKESWFEDAAQVRISISLLSETLRRKRTIEVCLL